MDHFGDIKPPLLGVKWRRPNGKAKSLRARSRGELAATRRQYEKNLAWIIGIDSVGIILAGRCPFSTALGPNDSYDSGFAFCQ
jgi:hypothetical protein